MAKKADGFIALWTPGFTAKILSYTIVQPREKLN